jgi:hypothetical protein
MYMKSSVPFKELFLLFILGCMSTRLLVAYAAKRISPKYLPVMGYLAALPAFGFAYIYMVERSSASTCRPIRPLCVERNKRKSRRVDVSLCRCYIRSYKFSHSPLVKWKHTKNVYLLVKRQPRVAHYII